MVEGENKSKRQKKTASQLEILEKSFAVMAYPSEALRVELSAVLRLSERQVSMWFAHRRVKDRKTQSATCNGVELDHIHVPVSKSDSYPFRSLADSKGVVPAASPVNKYYEPQQSIMELRAISFVEARLEEPFREDGPIFGMEFDPLPPDAFGSPLGTAEQQNQIRRPDDIKIFKQTDAKSSMGDATNGSYLHEYQFLPEHPTVRNDSYERGAPSHYFGSSVGVPNSRVLSLSTRHSYMHGNERILTPYCFECQIRGFNVLPQPANSVAEQKAFGKIGVMDSHLVSTLENPSMSSGSWVSLDDAKIAWEVEDHKKRTQRELAIQDMIMRKGEEQMKKEMERFDPEQQKQEQRLLREKQREERYQREQHRELERKEKFLKKEYARLEW